MKITTKKLRKIIKEELTNLKGVNADSPNVVYIFRTAVDKRLARKALDYSMISADWGIDEMMVDKSDEADVDLMLRDSRVRFKKQR